MPLSVASRGKASGWCWRGGGGGGPNPLAGAVHAEDAVRARRDVDVAAGREVKVVEAQRPGRGRAVVAMEQAAAVEVVAEHGGAADGVRLRVHHRRTLSEVAGVG